MNSSDENEGKSIVDRNLGDEWAGWVGDLSKYEKEIEEGKALFLSVYFIALFVITLFCMFLYYMMAPRLYEISPVADRIIMYGVIAVFSFIFIWSFLLLLTIATGLNLLFISRTEGLHVEWIYPAVYAIGGFFGISKDRLGNSLVKVNNALIYSTKKKFKSENLLVLLPRCLDKETRLKVTEITKNYGCNVFTATGGSSARRMVKKVRPDAIIGVACERDLVAGMADSPKIIPVIAISNKRPEGPCKNTSINVDEFEKAIKFLLKE